MPQDYQPAQHDGNSEQGVCRNAKDVIQRAQPATPSQAADIPLEQLETLARAVPQSEGWFDHMVVTMAMTGYVTLMRLVELRAVRRAGLKFVTSTGSKLTATQASRRPRTHMRGLLVHVAWRKQTQDQDCWIPVSCAHTMTRILDHIRNLNRIGYTGTMLFPSHTLACRRKHGHTRLTGWGPSRLWRTCADSW